VKRWRGLLVIPVIAAAVALFYYRGPDWHLVHDAFTASVLPAQLSCVMWKSLLPVRLVASAPVAVAASPFALLNVPVAVANVPRAKVKAP